MKKYTAALVALSLICAPAWGYIDPGTSSLLIQLQLAFAAGVLFHLKKILTFFRGLFRKSRVPK